MSFFLTVSSLKVFVSSRMIFFVHASHFLFVCMSVCLTSNDYLCFFFVFLNQWNLDEKLN